MMTIDEAVSISIQNFLNEDIMVEKKKKNHGSHKKSDKENKKKDKDGIKKNVIKKKNGQRGNFDYANDKKYNRNVTDSDNNAMAQVLDNPMVNKTEIAQELYPDHTRTGAVSQLDKKIHGKHSDSGYKYRLKNREIKRLRKILNRNGLI